MSDGYFDSILRQLHLINNDQCHSSVCEAASFVANTYEYVYTTGVGKSSFVAMRMASVLSNLGFRSMYLDPVEAAHGGIGRFRDGDMVICFSKSGSTSELVRLIPAIRDSGVSLIAVTCCPISPIGLVADILVNLGFVCEAEPYHVIPSASCTAMTIIADNIAFRAAQARGYTLDSVSENHPA